jgi:hypothetical protein
MGMTGFQKRRREQEEKLIAEQEFQKLVELAKEKKLKEEAVEEAKVVEDVKPIKNKKGK